MKFARYSSTFGLIGIMLFIAYIGLLSVVGDARMDDGNLGDEEMNVVEITIPILSMISLGLTAFIAFLHALRYSRMAWVVVIFLCFPLSTLYYWKFRKEELLTKRL